MSVRHIGGNRKQALKKLLEKNSCDYIVIEASGICEPLPIANTIEAVTEALIRNDMPVLCELDSVITVVDAFRLADEFECGDSFTRTTEDGEEEDLVPLLIQQIEFCNMVLLNKTDLVSKEQKDHIRAVVSALNPSAKMIETEYGKTDISSIVDTKLFDMQKAYNGAGWLQAIENDEAEHDHHEHHDHDHHDHDHDHDHDHHDHDHHHHDHTHCHSQGEALEYGINTYVYTAIEPFSKEKFEKAVLKLGKNVIRSKGFVWFTECPELICVYEQSGKQITLDAAKNWVAALPEDEQKEALEMYPELAESWDPVYGDRLNKIVFIGQGLDKDVINTTMNNALA